ncbi:MAG: tetratricopeptide repeat protein [Desulfurivibrionaceae bacterium]
MGGGNLRSVPSFLGFQSSAFSLKFLLPGLISCCLLLFVPAVTGCSGLANEKAVQNDRKELQESAPQEDTDHSCSYFYFLWGRSAELGDELEEAEEAYEKALICDPDREYIRKRLVGILIKMGKEEQALIHLQEMAAGDEKDIDNLFMFARLYSKMDKYQKARGAYQTILDIEPENQKALLLLGTLHARHGNFEEGREILEKLVEINKQSFMGYNYLAKLYREMNLPVKAAEAYSRALEINWSTELAREAVRFYESQDMYEEAVDIYERLLERDSANLEFHGHLINLYLQMNRLDKAMESLRDMKTYMADTLPLDIAIGRLLLKQQKYEEAVEHFRRLLKKGGQTGTVRGFLALAYHGSGRNEKAKEMLEGIPQSSEAYEDAVLMLLRIYQEEDNIGRAISLLEDAITTEESRNPFFYTVLAELYHEQGDGESGVRTYKRGLRFYPDNAEIRYNFALYLDKLGRTTEALEEMKQVLTIDPDNPLALNYVGYTWADQGVNLDKALTYIEKAVSARPDSGFIRDSLGWIYYRRGEYEKAVAELERAVELSPEDPTINEHLGDAYMKADEPDKADSAYRKAVRLYKQGDKQDDVKEKLEKLNP